ncbi:MAG: gliding motility-associated C-terminal domain-containing protein [Chitinophagales bacterium]
MQMPAATHLHKLLPNLLLPMTSASATTISCYGGTADVDLTATGSSTPYTYFWNNGSLTEDLTGVSAGTYGVMITDAHGCTANASVTITQPTALQLSVAVTNVLCNGGNGSIDITVAGATPNYSFAWSNGATTEDITAGAGTYTVTVTDANGCTATASGTITQPSALSMVAQTVNVSCNGGSNGFINITVSGGVFPYSYDWGGGNTQEDQYSIAAGTYTVTATDANGCTISQSYTITEPAAITSSIVTTDVTCAGANNGAADLTVNGGTAPYTFSWSNFKVSEDLTGIAGGTYYVIITDANGCTHRDSAVINEPTPLVLSTVVTNISCNGNNTGAVDLTVSGGTLNYSFAWSNGATTEDLSGLAQGVYTVTVTDGNGCTATASAIVTQPNALAVVAAIQDVTCAGDNNGAINLTVSGGSLPYAFNWNNGATTEDLVNLLAGTYDVTITDNNACSVSGSYIVNEPPAIASTIVGTNVLCQGANNGTADLTVSGGTPPYTFLWSNFQGSEDVNNLDGGIYYVLITDASGCTHRDSVIILEPSPLILSTVVVNVSCNNANDGTIDLTVQGGTSNYSYAWSSGQTTQDLSGLAGGTYVVTVTDFNGCTAVSSNTVVNPSPIAANFISHRPLCYGDANGSIDMIPTGGTPPFNFAWSNGATTEDVNGLIADTYFITITDSRGCTKTDSVVITQPDPLVTSGFIKNVSCAGFKDGFLDITGYGGTLPYTFQWNTLQSTEDIGNLSGGNYYVTVTDANLCQVASLYVVSEPDTLKLELFGTNVSCNGGNNGTAFAVYSGGTTPYQFLWEDFTTGPIRTGLSAGYYAIMLTDSNGCFALDSITLTSPTAIGITGVTTDVLCNGAGTGAIDITVTGGTGTFTFAWSNGATTEDVTALVAGSYTVTVTDASGCTATASYTITEPLPMALSTIFTNPGCHGGTNGSVSVIALQGVGPYTYSWNTTPVQTAASAQALTAGTYTVTVTDSKGCTASVSQTLTQPDSIVVTTDSHAAKCFNTASGYVVADVTGGQMPFVYELNGFAQASDTFANLLPGDYIILVTDVNGCEGTATFNIPQASQISVDLGVTQQVIATGMNTQLVATANSTSPILNYFWTPDSLFDFSACGDPLNCNNPLVHPATTTLFTVTVMNSDSCYASDTISVFVSSSLSYFISTAFTPNGDGLNDRFQFDILGADNLEIDIFNRWGQRFYHDDNQTNGLGNSDGWDGTYNGKPAPEDTYVYKLKITYFDNTTRDIEGTITLMR